MNSQTMLGALATTSCPFSRHQLVYTPYISSRLSPFPCTGSSWTAWARKFSKWVCFMAGLLWLENHGLRFFTSARSDPGLRDAHLRNDQDSGPMSASIPFSLFAAENLRPFYASDLTCDIYGNSLRFIGGCWAGRAVFCPAMGAGVSVP